MKAAERQLQHLLLNHRSTLTVSRKAVCRLCCCRLQMFSDKLVEVISMDDDFVWIHDYHLLVLPSLLRKRFHRLRCGLFLHSPFPSSEIWRTFPKREELLRSLLNVDLIGDPLLP